MRISELDTPVLTADLDAVDRNIDGMQRYCDEQRIALRPHIKTHKLPEIARLQLAAGARGITCQKLGEAEIFAAAGFDDILISFPLIGAQKVARLRALAAQVRLCVAVDSTEGAEAIDGLDVDVLVECDTGFGRTGVQTPEEAIRLARRVERLRGFMVYPSPPGTAAWLARVLDVVGPVDCISVGGTPTARSVHELGIATELRVGTYVYGDRACVADGSVPPEDCALRVVATVVSTPTSGRAIVDAGSKALSSDLAEGVEGYGLVVEDAKARIYKLNEEHGHVEMSARIGDRVSIVPNHACGAVNMHDEIVLHRGGEVVETLPIAARGKLR